MSKIRRQKPVVSISSVAFIFFVCLSLLFIQAFEAEAAKPIVLTAETCTPIVSPPGKIIGPEFISGLEKASRGSIKVRWHGSGAFGPPAELYTRIIQGIIDFGHIIPGYTPGVFTFSDIVELPVHHPSAQIATKALVEIYNRGYCDKEYKGTKFLFGFAVGPFQLWSNFKATKVEDLSGKKIRCPAPVFVDITKNLGAIPVTLPVSEMYTALQKGIVDGSWAIGEMGLSLKITDVTKYIIKLDIGTNASAVLMNQNSYDKLPETCKKYIEENRERMSLFASEVFDKANNKGFAVAQEKKLEIIKWPEAELKKFDKMLIPVYSAWASRIEAKGYPGKDTLKQFYQIMKNLGVKEPFVLPQ